MEPEDQPVGPTSRRLKSWQGWLLLAVALILVPLLFFAYLHDGAGDEAATLHPVSDALGDLSPEERRLALEAALQQSPIPCGRVVRSFFQGLAPDGAAYWNVACANGAALSLQFALEEPLTIRIVRCELLEQTGLACFTTFGELT